MKKFNELQSYLTRLRGLMLTLIILCSIGSGKVWGGVRTGWTRVTSVSEITSGGTFIIGWESSANSNTIVPMINKPSTLTGTTGSQATSYLYSGTNTDATGNGTLDMSDNGSGATSNYEFEIVAGASTGQIAIKLSDDTYLGFYGSSNNNCRRYASVTTNSSFTPTVGASSPYNVSLQNVAQTGRYIKFNNNSTAYRFSNYNSTEKIVLYKKAASCDKNVTITKGTPESGGSFALDKTGSQATCSGLTVTVSNIVAPSGKKFSAITQSGIASGVTIDNSAKTVTYAANTTGSSTINVTYEDKGCTDHGASSITSGASTDDDYGPVCAYNNYSTRQILYTKTDLDLAAGKKGTIKSIYFEYSGAAAMAARTIEIFMANTALTALSAGNCVPYASFTQVYSGTFSCGSAGWYEITLDTPFDYNGIGNLVVLIDDNTGSWASSKNFKYHSVTSPTPTNVQIYYNNDGTNINPSTTDWSDFSATNNRPNTKFCIQEADMTPATVTLMDNGATITEPSAGAGVTLPSRAGCTGYTFKGWTKTWVAPQSSWTTTAPTIIPPGSYTPSSNENLYPVYTKEESGGGSTTKTYGWEASEPYASSWTIDGQPAQKNSNAHTGSYAGYINTNNTYVTFNDKVKVTEFSFWLKRTSTNSNYNVYIETSTDGSTWSAAATYAMSEFGNGSYTQKTKTWDGSTAYYVRFHCYNTTAERYVDDISITYSGGTTTLYISVPNCCSDPGLAYGTGNVTKTFGDDDFTNTLTNSHSVNVSYTVTSASPAGCVTVNSSGLVHIVSAGTATINATSAEQTVSSVKYCADEASYTLTVNKANISPTLTYSPASVAVGDNSATPSVSGNTGSGTVTYSSSNPSVATVDPSTGVVTGVAVGSVTVTATIGATTNYNENTATATVNITAASNFPNGKTIFIQAHNTSAWTGGGCVKAWFHSYGGSEGAQSTYWLFDVVGGDDDGKKLFATVVPATGDLPYLDIQRFAANCNDWWNKNGGCSYSDAAGSNTIRSTGKNDDASDGDYIRWNASGVTLSLHGAPNGWGSSLGTFADQGNGVWTATYNNYAPANAAGETQDFKISTNYNGWIGNTGSNNNATLDGMHVGSTYNITATLDIKDHSLVMSKTFVKGTVHFNMNGHGSAIADLTNVAAGSKISAPSPAPTAAGWRFAGWYKEAGCTNAWNFGSDVVNETMTLYAKWVQTFTVTYNANGGTSTMTDSNSPYDTGSTVTVKSNSFTAPTGKEFDHWNTAANNSGASYNPSATFTISANTTLYAQWRNVNYTVTMEQNPAAGATLTGGTTTANYGGTINISTNVPSGYRFNGWTASPSVTFANASATTTSFTMPAGNVTVTANFQQTHTVDWYVGGSAPANKIGDDGQTTVVDHGGKIEDFPATAPDGSACDKVFVGWTNTSSYEHGTSPLFNDVAGSPTINADASFYAVFAAGGDTEDEITVDETGATAESSAYESWSDVSISSDAIYAGNTAGGSSGNASVQMRSNNSNSGIVTTSSGGKVTKVIVDWNSSSANGRTLDIYGKNTAYTEATDLYDNSTQGTKLGSIVKGTSTELEISGDYSYIGLRSNSGAMYLNSITISWSSATGHTITCADCGSSVTPTYTAAPTGGTVSVTKSATPVASGSTVKTCTTVDLTVTITPATHYTLTGFTATGLTTGTATISPAVNTVVPTASAQTFTVTVSAGATGTLNLTPTFTPETPLTITLNTNSKGTFTTPTEFPIYAGETFRFPDVTPSDPTCATFVGWIAGTTFDGDGTTHDAPVVITAGTVSAAQNANATYTAVFYETETTETDAYVKVTETPANWANDHYLIVYENGDLAFDGSRTDGDGDKIDAASNTVAVSITSSAIAATNALAASEWKIALISGTNYSIQSASGKYIGQGSDANGLTTSTNALSNTLSINSGDFGVVSAGGAYLRYNATSGQERFRYYKSSSYTSQKAIQLYKLGTAVVETRTYTTNPACTPKYRVTVASVTGGSPNANPKFNPEGETVTLTANPAAGYTFTGWTLTHTEGGAAASVTYTEGSASTETAAFEMPAYDVTVTASFAKKAVTSLQVKDGETVIPNSGTVNISTGANKTLDVVITPADAFDHSWTATVTAGGTYASITNKTDDGFRVNGLAQGDATVTVTAPNDGNAKVVTFTVHVTDVLPTEIILKREGSDTPIETLIMYYDASESKGQYVKVNVSFTPTPTNKGFTFSSASSGKVGSHSHAPASGYEVLVANGVTTDPVNCTFTSSADGSVTKVLAVTVLPILTDQFVDYIHGNATQSVPARLSNDRYDIITDINTPSLTDASDANPTSPDCTVSHYHLIGWLPKATAEALWAAGTPITEATEGLVRAGASVEATGQTWYAIWAKEAE